MRADFYKYRFLILSSDIGETSETELSNFESYLKTLYGKNILNQIVRWCDKLNKIRGEK